MTLRYHIVVHVPSLSGGGAERVAVELARYFVGKGMSVVLFVYHSGFSYELPAGVDVVVAKSRRHLGRVAEFRAFLKCVDATVVLSILRYANLISLLATVGLRKRPRLVTSEHSSCTALQPRHARDKTIFKLLTWLYQRSDAIVAVSNGVATDLRKRVHGTAKAKISTIYNPCYIANGYVPREKKIAGRTILAVGRLVWHKAFDVLIDAFSLVAQRVPDVRLVIVGEGPDRGKLEAQIARLGVSESVELPGFDFDVGKYFRNADLFAFSSRSESFGNVVVEALSYGLPIVSTNCEHGPAEILEAGRYGRLVPVDDATALANAILDSLYESIDPRTQVSRAEKFSLETIGSAYARVMGICI
jgi:glycosyltransferase involved in cell wall biosynthesis